ncbi:MAG: hypothetical protein GY772_14780 [bacterium]|nr:hypothetical protein [bacterium]
MPRRLAFASLRAAENDPIELFSPSEKAGDAAEARDAEVETPAVAGRQGGRFVDALGGRTASCKGERCTKWGRCGRMACRAPLRLRVAAAGGAAFLACSRWKPSSPGSCRFVTAVSPELQAKLPERMRLRVRTTT